MTLPKKPTSEKEKADHERQERIKKWLPFLKKIAGQLFNTLGHKDSVFDRAEIESLCNSAFMKAIEAKEVAGKSYGGYLKKACASYIIDEIRKFDPNSRKVRKIIQNAKNKGENIPVAYKRIISFELYWLKTPDGERLVSLLDLIPDEDVDNPYKKIRDKDDRRRIRNSLSILNEKEFVVIDLIFFKKITAKEIAEKLGISQAAISWRKKAALNKLKDHLSKE